VIELGITSFGDTTVEGGAQRLRELVEEIELADQTGLDVFAIGEHHRSDYAVSAPAVVLSAAAARTERIRLGSAVTVLSSDDPVRVFEAFATVDGISDGRAEIWAGRGSFTESFPLFGYDLDDYDELYSEKLEMLLTIREAEFVHWPGTTHTQRIEGLGVYPRPVQDPLPVWIAVGGTPQSVVRAGVLGLPLVIAIIGGQPARFRPLVDLYRRAAAEAGSEDAGNLPLAINSHGFVASSAQEAKRLFFPGYADAMSRIGRERGWPPLTRDQFEAGTGPDGHLYLGSPEEVAEKIVTQYDLFGMDRFLIQLSVGRMPRAELMKSIELFGTAVAPLVRDEVAKRRSSTQMSGQR
jgi:probable LLM family oxidoreductase